MIEEEAINSKVVITEPINAPEFSMSETVEGLRVIVGIMGRIIAKIMETFMKIMVFRWRIRF